MIAEHVSKLKADVFRSNTWLMLFENKAKILKKWDQCKEDAAMPSRVGEGRIAAVTVRPPVQGRCPRRGDMGPEVWGRGRAVAMGGGG